MVTQKDFREAMSCVCAAVNVVTTAGKAGRGGFTATAMCSVSDDPPQLLVCMKRSSAQSDLFVQNKHFCVNVLTSAQTELAGFFAGGAKDMSARYAAADWTTLATGSPVLDDALVNFDCELDAVYPAGTHNIMIGRVVAIARKPDINALIYFERTFLDVASAQSATTLAP